jgi:hypothetical protein
MIRRSDGPRQLYLETYAGELLLLLTLRKAPLRATSSVGDLKPHFSAVYLHQGNTWSNFIAESHETNNKAYLSITLPVTHLQSSARIIVKLRLGTFLELVPRIQFNSTPKRTLSPSHLSRSEHQHVWRIYHASRPNGRTRVQGQRDI